MLVIVSVPKLPAKLCPTAVIATPLIETTAGPSPGLNIIEPTVVSPLPEAFVPSGSLPRAGRPDSSTLLEALVAPVGLSGVTMIAAGSSSSSSSGSNGNNSSCSNSGKESAVGGNRSPNSKGSPISPTGSAKLPPELCGGPAAGCGSLPTSKAARLRGGTDTPSMTN